MPINAIQYKEVHHYLNKVSSTSEKTWQEVADMLEEKIFNKHEFFAKQGRYEHKVGIVISGVFRSFIEGKGGSEFTKTLYTPIYYKTPISYLGSYTALVTGTINKINIQALTDAKILMCSYDRWKALSESNKEALEWSKKLANLFFMGKERREMLLGTMTAEQRYILFRDEFPELENQINQYHIAQFLGITHTQLSRIRKKVYKENG